MLVALLANPVKLAVMVPAVKSPFTSLATIADAVFALVAVVAELLTFPAVDMVASFVSTIAAEALMSALTIVPSRILALVTASALILTAVIALSEMTGFVALEFKPARSPAN